MSKEMDEQRAAVVARGTTDGKNAAIDAVNDYGLDNVMSDQEDYWVGPLSGEWAGDPTPISLARDFGVDTQDGDAVDEIADLYEEAWNAAWLAYLDERTTKLPEGYADKRYRFREGSGAAFRITRGGQDGFVYATYVGDDKEWSVELSQLQELGEDEYCSGCGQIGCTADGRE